MLQPYCTHLTSCSSHISIKRTRKNIKCGVFYSFRQTTLEFRKSKHEFARLLSLTLLMDPSQLEDAKIIDFSLNQAVHKQVFRWAMYTPEDAHDDDDDANFEI